MSEVIKQKFIYEAKVLDIHDGDTISVEIDCGFQLSFKDKIRFFGVNAPELKIKNENKKMIENTLGTQTLNVVKDFIKVGDTILIETIKDKKEKYGRYLAKIFITKNKKQICLNDYLLTNGYVVKMIY